MPRVVELTVPTDLTDELVSRLRQSRGLLGLQLQRGASLHPPGDVLRVSLPTGELSALMELLDQKGLGRVDQLTVMTQEPESMITGANSEAVVRDSDDSTWEEIEREIAKESNMTPNMMLIMALSGVLAAIGLYTNALHIVIAAMLIAPGFEPLVRIGLGAVTGSRAWVRGVADTCKGYAALAIGAMLTALVMQGVGDFNLTGKASYLPSGVLPSYWSGLTASAAATTAAGSIGGAILVATGRAVLTGGVMMALALIPTAALAGMSAVAGDTGVLITAVSRWAFEAASVVVASLAVLGWKRYRRQRRRMWL